MKKLNYTIALIFILCLVGCGEENKSTSKKSSSSKEVSASKSNTNSKLFLLENNGIKIALPRGFERQSVAEYELFLESNYSKKTLEYEKDHLRDLRNKEGQFYMFFNPENASTLTVNVTNPLNISSDNPQGLLNMVTSTHTNAKKETQRAYKKQTAGFSDNEGISIFKAIYEVKEKGKENPMYEHSYIITNKDLSMLMTLTSTENINLDPYIEKMQL